MTERLDERAQFRLRAAKDDDYPFALALYIDGSAGLLKKIGRWNQARILSRFKRAYKLGDGRIIIVDGEEVGWIQVVDFVGQLYLRQLHLMARAQGHGIGTRLIEDLQARGTSLGKPVTLDVIHGNRAKELYLRLGFRPIRANLDKTRMLWRAPRKRRTGRAQPVSAGG
jgi:ribosomal protein S18 acetylase RimI-like enzyme